MSSHYTDQTAIVVLQHLKKSLRVLLPLKWAQGALVVLWLIILLVESLPLFDASSLIGVLVLVLIPFGIALLVSLQSWRSKSSFGSYQEIKERVATREIHGKYRTEALQVLHKYQLYSAPLFVRGAAGKNFAVTALIFGFVCAMLIIITI